MDYWNAEGMSCTRAAVFLLIYSLKLVFLTAVHFQSAMSPLEQTPLDSGVNKSS